MSADVVFSSPDIPASSAFHRLAPMSMLSWYAASDLSLDGHV